MIQQIKMTMRTSLLLATMLLTACGFHLRGQNALALPFQTLYIQSANPYTPFIGELKRAVQSAGAGIADSPDAAQLTLHIVSETMGKQILSLSGGGRVREYQLSFSVWFNANNREQQQWLAPGEILLSRNLPYDDEQVMAKEREEILLYQDMRADAVQQLLRRLNHARAPNVAKQPQAPQ